MSIFHIRGKLHKARCESTRSLKLIIPRAKEFDKDSPVTKNTLKGENKNIIYEYEQSSTMVSKSLPSLSSELKNLQFEVTNATIGILASTMKLYQVIWIMFSPNIITPLLRVR